MYVYYLYMYIYLVALSRTQSTLKQECTCICINTANRHFSITVHFMVGVHEYYMYTEVGRINEMRC